jgi:hypothetical protein
MTITAVRYVPPVALAAGGMMRAAVKRTAVTAAPVHSVAIASAAAATDTPTATITTYTGVTAAAKFIGRDYTALPISHISSAATTSTARSASATTASPSVYRKIKGWFRGIGTAKRESASHQ